MDGSATANVKGAWVEFSAAAPFDAAGFFISFGPAGISVADYLVDVGVGAAGSEQVILSNLLGSVANFNVGGEVFIPLPIKAGERVAVRLQSSDASLGVPVLMQLVAGDFFSQLGLGRATTYGADTTDSGGTVCDPGATANTKGAWTEIIAALTNPIKYLVVCVGTRNNGVINAANETLFDIGVGAAGSEQIIVADTYTYASTGMDMFLPCYFGKHVSVKAGERLAIRSQSTNTDATDRLADFVLIGFD